ncbi:mechanosensitive ion channel protein MscS [Halobacteriales archaeon QH_7_65_31]|nr:MAG: mechanosensitive ion channel protein MscS [Halobacteriales archaeon QH_7_65_31]
MPHDSGASGFVAGVHQLLAERFDLFIGILVLILGVFAGGLARRYISRLLHRFDIPRAVEGTPFERTARSVGTSTVGLLANLSGLFVLALGASIALQLFNAPAQTIITDRFSRFLRQLFIAAVVLIAGFIVGDKLELYLRERLRSIKLPEVNVLPAAVKYSVFYVAGLVALAQVGVATLPLLVLLSAYAFGVVFIGGLATKPLLVAGAAGVYLLLTEPYAIGDEVELGGRRGIVQEVDVFVTRIDGETEEFVVPNNQVFADTIVVVRD